MLHTGTVLEVISLGPKKMLIKTDMPNYFEWHQAKLPINVGDKIIMGIEKKFNAGSYIGCVSSLIINNVVII